MTSPMNAQQKSGALFFMMKMIWNWCSVELLVSRRELRRWLLKCEISLACWKLEELLRETQWIPYWICTYQIRWKPWTPIVYTGIGMFTSSHIKLFKETPIHFINFIVNKAIYALPYTVLFAFFSLAYLTITFVLTLPSPNPSRHSKHQGAQTSAQDQKYTIFIHLYVFTWILLILSTVGIMTLRPSIGSGYLFSAWNAAVAAACLLVVIERIVLTRLDFHAATPHPDLGEYCKGDCRVGSGWLVGTLKFVGSHTGLRYLTGSPKDYY